MEASHPSAPHILVVDDETDICLALSDLFGSEGYQVDAVETGSEALRRVSPAHPYSAVILDLGLPDMDGLTVLQRLHVQDETLPVIILTAHGDQKEKLATLRHHAFAHLMKPYNRREVLAMVRRAVEVKTLNVKTVLAEGEQGTTEVRKYPEQKRTQILLSESEQRLHLALQGGDMGIWDWDIASDHIIWSEEVAGLFGLADSLLPRTFKEFLPLVFPDDRNMMAQAVRLTLEDNAPFVLDHRILLHSGEVRWLSCKGQVIRNHQGRAQRMLGTVQDITGRKEQDLQLRESETRFREVVEAIREVFWVSNPEKTEIFYISPGYESIWGRSCASLYASPQSWMDHIHPDDRDRIRDHALTQQVGGNYEEEYRIVKPDGVTRWIRDRAFPVKDSTGAVYRIVGVAEDITSQKRVHNGLHALAQASRTLKGPSLFRTLVWEMASILNVKFAFIAEHVKSEPPRARTHASFQKGEFADTMEYSLSGTPCGEAREGKPRFWGEKVRQCFPQDRWLAQWGIESYLVHPIQDMRGAVIGHVGIMDVRPMVQDPLWSGILEFVALRSAFELQRKM